MSEMQAYWATFAAISGLAILRCLWLNHKERRVGLR